MRFCCRAWGLVLVLVLPLTGCADGGSPSGSRNFPGTSPNSVVRTAEAGSSAAEAEVTTPEPSTVEPLPGGIPTDLIGRWVGGEGAASGYTVVFRGDGRYQLSHDKSTAIPRFVEYGVAGGTGEEIVLRPVEVAGPVERVERTAGWSLQNAGDVYGYDIEVLVLTDLYGEFSYVKDG